MSSDDVRLCDADSCQNNSPSYCESSESCASGDEPESGGTSKRKSRTFEQLANAPAASPDEPTSEELSRAPVAHSTFEPPPSYETAIGNDYVPYEQHRTTETVKNVDQINLPRKFVIVQIHVAGPSRRRNSAAPQNFEVRATMDSPPLLTIRREMPTRQNSSNPNGIRISLLRSDEYSSIVSEWTSPDPTSHITCVCVDCKETTLRTTSRVPADFSLQVAGPSGRIDGYVQLNHHRMDVTGPERWRPLFSIDSRPGGQRRREIKRGSNPSSLHPVGLVEAKDEAIFVKLPQTSAPVHDILLLSGIFTTLFVKKVWHEKSSREKVDAVCEVCLAGTGVVCTHLCVSVCSTILIGLLCSGHVSRATATF